MEIGVQLSFTNHHLLNEISEPFKFMFLKLIKFKFLKLKENKKREVGKAKVRICTLNLRKLLKKP